MNVSFVRQTLYSLKRDYGTPLEMYTRVSSDVDLKTGAKVVTKQVFRISRAVLLPKTIARISLQLLGEPTEFRYGGLVDQNSRAIVIDMQDYPASYQVRPNDYVVIDTRRFNIKEAVLTEPRLAVILMVEETVNESPARIVERTLISDLHLQSRGTGTT